MTLRIDKISKRYGNQWALRDVTLDVAKGEVYGIFGATGSGKTTLLRCIAGKEQTNGGSVSADASDGIFLAERAKPSGLAAVFGRNSAALSDGEASVDLVRRGLSSGKEVVLLDEPFFSVDSAARAALVAEIRDHSAKGNAVLIASSQFGELADICDRMCVLVRGEAGQTGTPQEVYDDPANSAVASIAGTNNLFEARRVTSTNAELPEFVTIEGEHRLHARATEKSRLGAINKNVLLAIRPEQISISFGASFPEDNLIKAVVAAIRFHGETTIVELDANGLRLKARVFRVVGLTVGEECMVSLPPDRIHVLKD